MAGSEFVARPYIERFHDIVEQADHLLLGVSPFNSYYSAATVERLIAWSVARFKIVDVLLPGYEAAHTLTAVGVAPLEAVRRVTRKLRRLRNAALRALSRHGVTDAERHVYTWTKLLGRASYARERQRLCARYHSDPHLRHACHTVARGVLRGLAGSEPTREQLESVVAYPLAELPLLMNSPAIFEVASSVFGYHQPSVLFDLLVNEAGTIKPAPRQALVVLTEAARPSG